MKLSRNKAKAYLLGAYLGDGCTHGKSYFIIVGMDLDLLNKVRRCISRLFPDIKEKIKIKEEALIGNTKGVKYRLWVYDQDLCQFLRKLTNYKRTLPREKWLRQPSVMKEFIAGLLDTDGWVQQGYQSNGYHSPRWSIGFTSVSTWLNDFSKILIRFGVHVGGPSAVTRCKSTVNQAYRITLGVSSFDLAGLYFSIKRKRFRLKLWKWWQKHMAPEYIDEFKSLENKLKQRYKKSALKLRQRLIDKEILSPLG